MHVILDLSRLLASIQRPTPTGIDRVELAYAQRWLRRAELDCTFVGRSVWGWYAELPRQGVAEMIGTLDQTWTTGEGFSRVRACIARLQAQLALGSGRARLRNTIAARPRSVFLLVSHRALDQAGPIRALREAGARFVPMIHDLIPLTHPEYQRTRQMPVHARRVSTTAELADGVIVNSAATWDSLRPHLNRHGRPMPPVGVAPLGIRLPPPLAPLPPGGLPPYFVALGTVEPRKNHQLLLHIWRELSRSADEPVPQLLILGRRGWENAHVVALLDRCRALKENVLELGGVPDHRVAELLAGARALLFPSFAEGYGLPVAEALSLGTPVICSDLPALREVGGKVPDYLDPLDGPAWRRAILDYARPDSPVRAAQLARLAGWHRPEWTEHFAAVDALLTRVVRGPAPVAVDAVRPGPRLRLLEPADPGLA